MPFGTVTHLQCHRDELCLSHSPGGTFAVVLPTDYSEASFYLVQSFLSTFFPANDTETLKKDIGTIRINIPGDDFHSDLVIDMKWFLGFLLDHAGIKVEFDGSTSFDWEARDLVKLLDVAETVQFWRSRLASFGSIKLRTYTCWCPGRTDSFGRYAHRSEWILIIGLEPEDVEAWGDGEEEDRACTNDLLVNMGLRVTDEAGNERSTFMGLKIEVPNQRKYAHDRSRSCAYYW